MSAHAARRLLPMADNVAAVIGIELLRRRSGLRLSRRSSPARS